MRCLKLKIWLLLMFFGLITAGVASANATAVSIAVAANGPEQNATVSDKAGRAPYFLFFDSRGKFLKAERNPFAGIPGGAGPKAAVFLSGEGVTLVVAGEFGAKMEQALSSFKIEYITKTGVAHEVVQAVLEKN